VGPNPPAPFPEGKGESFCNGFGRLDLTKPAPCTQVFMSTLSLGVRPLPFREGGRGVRSDGIRQIVKKWRRCISSPTGGFDEGPSTNIMGGRG
jgi:hypothetical protein